MVASPRLRPPQVLFYGPAGDLVARREYLGAVSGLWLSSGHTVALVDGRLVVHPVRAAEGHAPDEEDAVLPPPSAPQVSWRMGLAWGGGLWESGG
jgi:hypothetical protein